MDGAWPVADDTRELQAWRGSGAGGFYGRKGVRIEGDCGRERAEDDQSKQWIERNENGVKNRGRGRSQRNGEQCDDTDERNQPAFAKHANDQCSPSAWIDVTGARTVAT